MKTFLNPLILNILSKSQNNKEEIGSKVVVKISVKVFMMMMMIRLLMLMNPIIAQGDHSTYPSILPLLSSYLQSHPSIDRLSSEI